MSQYDQHISEMTVRETLDFSARCQGIGGREGRFAPHLVMVNISQRLKLIQQLFTAEDIMKEISRREKEAGIVPEPDIDTYMKVKLT